MMAQCLLEICESDKVTQTTTWLESAKLNIGCQVRLKGETRLWTVKRISDKKMSKEYVNERSQDYKHTRQASDI